MRSKKRRRKSKSAAVYIPVGIILILALTVMGISVFLRVMEIDVVGAATYTKEEIITASGISRGEYIYFLDTDSAAKKIHATMPYISEVSIEPAPPSGVRITVSETSAIAVIKYPGGALIIDSSGKVLAREDAAPGGLIEIRGLVPAEAETEVGTRMRAPEGGETQMKSLTDVLSAIEKSGLISDISYLDVANIATISFGYDGRFTVVLGGSGNVSHKLSQLPQFVEGVNENHPPETIGEINMSDPSGKWRFTPKS